MQTAFAGRSLSEISRDDVVAWCERAREQLASKASELEIQERELACTILGAAIGETSALFFQIGDGAMVTVESEAYEVVFWPQSGEYANCTYFLTDPDFSKSLLFKRTEGQVNRFAAFTDGLERLILRFNEKSVHAPFLQPLFRVVDCTDQLEPLFQALEMFLDSDAVNARTDDDKTLILATRMESGTRSGELS